MVTPSGPNSARPLSSTQQSHIPSAALTQGNTAVDLVSQTMEDVLQHFKVDILNQVTSMVGSRPLSQPHVPKLPPSQQHLSTSPVINQEHDHQEYDEDHFHRHHRSSSQRRSHESNGSSWDEDRIKQIKGFKLVMDARNPDLFDGKSPALYLP